MHYQYYEHVVPAFPILFERFFCKQFSSYDTIEDVVFGQTPVYNSRAQTATPM